jgi:hypothetical protein
MWINVRYFLNRLLNAYLQPKKLDGKPTKIFINNKGLYFHKALYL